MNQTTTSNKNTGSNLYKNRVKNLHMYLNKKSSINKREPLRNKELDGDIMLALGFTESWVKMYDELVEYKNRYGNCCVSSNNASKELNAWCLNQRSLFKTGALSRQQIDRLDSIGFVWNISLNNWNEMFNKLADYKSKHGDCCVGTGNCSDTTLVSWARRQRLLYTQGALSEYKVNCLKNIGFNFSSLSSKWVVSYRQILKMKCSDSGYIDGAQLKKNKELRRWLCIQEYRTQRNLLSKPAQELIATLKIK